MLLFRDAAGAMTNIRNNEKQLPYDLSAKNPEVGRLLMIRGGWVCVWAWLACDVTCITFVVADEGEGYGEDEDSD